MIRRTMLFGVLALMVAAPALVYAEHTHFWRQSDYSDFEKGTAKGVAIRSDGRLMPAPKFAAYSDPNLAYLWALRMDSRGRIYGAGGSDAKVLRFDDPNKPTTVFESPELAAQTITFDAHDNLYVGTSPDGKIYKVTPEGQKSVFFDPKSKYIWALAVDSQGVLFAGTGDDGKIFAVTPEGQGQLFYQSDERHARSLAFDSKGNLLVGTDPDGLILRIDISRADRQAPPKAGASFVLYETDKKEVTSLLADSSGKIYAAAIGEKQRAPAPAPVTAVLTPQPTSPLTAQPGAATISIQPQPAQVAAPFSFFPSTTGGSDVVEISPEGAPTTWWSSREELVFAMGFSADGKILLGTGNKGAIIELEGNNVYSSIAKTASAQVTSLIAGRDGSILVGTANPGKIFTLGPGYEARGSFESDPFDAKIFSHWGRLTWWGDNGATQGKVAFYVRSGNTSSPEKNWSAWAGPYKNVAGEAVSCPPARFIQWKAVFLETDKGAPPNISWVSVAYQPENVAPVVDDIAIQDPGVRVQGFTAQPGGPGTAAPVQLRMPQHPGSNPFPVIGAITDTAAKPPKVEVPPQGFEEKGYESVLWNAHDDNDDDLIFSIYYRGEGEQNWRLLKDKLTQRFYSWDTTTMPDGAYYLKIVASDSPANPPQQALLDERASDRFEIENTPPRIENLHADTSGPAAKISFDGVSSAVAIAHAQYSVDAGDWLTAFPVGVLSDSPQESYQIAIPDLPPGEHTIAVQISDQFDNTTAAKVTFTVGPRRAK
jgi:WD40 repeat protein